MKSRDPASTRKKVVVLLLDHTALRGYLSPATLGPAEELDLLTADGEHQAIPLREVKCVYFVREFTASFELERKAFFSRPKLDGLWVRIRFRDHDTLEGIVANDLLALLDHGLQLTPPDLNGNSIRLFVPRSAVAELKVLGVVGVARRASRPARAADSAQTKLFRE